MSDEVFKLGRSSFGEVKNIIIGYAHFEHDVKLDALARLLAVNKAIISGNNGFLADMGLIEGGKTKNITPLGRSLGRALEHNREEDIKKHLREVIQGSQFLSDMVSTVRIREGMIVDDLAAHILYASGQPHTKSNATGARSVVDMLVESGVLTESDGRLRITTILKEVEVKTFETPPPGQTTEISQVRLSEPVPAIGQSRKQITPSPTIAINIQLHLPETESAAVYEELFKALRKYLLEPTIDEDAD